MTFTGKREPRGRLHRRDHDGGTRHVAFHVFHRRARLQAQAARVESHALADQGRAWDAPPPLRYSRMTNRGGSSEPAATPSSPPNRSLADPRFVPDVDGEPASAATRPMRSASCAGDFSAGECSPDRVPG